MSNLTSVKTYIQVEESQFNSAVSESYAQDVGQAINYLNDKDTTNDAKFATALKKDGALFWDNNSTTSSITATTGIAPTAIFATTSSQFAMFQLIFTFNSIGTTTGTATFNIDLRQAGANPVFNLIRMTGAGLTAAPMNFYAAATANITAQGAVSISPQFLPTSKDGIIMPLVYVPESSQIVVTSDPLGTGSSFQYRMLYQKFTNIT